MNTIIIYITKNYNFNGTVSIIVDGRYSFYKIFILSFITLKQLGTLLKNF